MAGVTSSTTVSTVRTPTKAHVHCCPITTTTSWLHKDVSSSTRTGFKRWHLQCGAGARRVWADERAHEPRLQHRHAHGPLQTSASLRILQIHQPML